MDQMRELREEVSALRARIQAAEDRAEAAEKAEVANRQTLEVALRHLRYLEDVMRQSGLPVPPRPSLVVRDPEPKP